MCVDAVVADRVSLFCGFSREVQVMESQGGSGATDGGGSDGQSGQAASTALIEKILSEEPRWQGKICITAHQLVSRLLNQLRLVVRLAVRRQI